MARKIPEDRFRKLIGVATEVFIERGYRLTQMADVATALGLAKGTLYVYVESKEALFDLCVRHAILRNPIETPAELPVPTPPAGSLSQFLREQLRERAGFPMLRAALERERALDIRNELDAVFREMFVQQETYAVAIKLAECAVGLPEIAEPWQTLGREGTRDLLQRYLESRIRAGQLRAFADPRLPARYAIESIATWAMHIKWDRRPQQFDEKAACDNVIEFLVRGLLAD